MKINMTWGQITWLTSNIPDRNIDTKRVIITFLKIVALKNGFDQLNFRSWALHCYKKRLFSINLGIIIKYLIRHGHKHVLTSDFGIQNKDQIPRFVRPKKIDLLFSVTRARHKKCHAFSKMSAFMNFILIIQYLSQNTRICGVIWVLRHREW